MNNVKGYKTVDQLIKTRKEKKNTKVERFIAKLEKEKEKEESNAETNKAQPAHKRKYTVSIALPCSIIDVAQTEDLKCYVATMIARCAAMCGVNEIIIYNDTNKPIPTTPSGEYALMGKLPHSALTLAGILQYMECPPYLREYLFPSQPLFSSAARMNPLCISHHDVRNSSFREGIVSSTQPKPGRGSFVSVGLQNEVEIDRVLEVGLRVTIRMTSPPDERKKLRGKVVSPKTPQLEKNIYWGYSVRLANQFSQVLNESTFGKEYDIIIGTSEKGSPVDEAKFKKVFKHALIVFGGMEGLEAVIETDKNLSASKPQEIFPFYLNTCPNQGSRTIRTEEAVFISLPTLLAKFHTSGSSK